MPEACLYLDHPVIFVHDAEAELEPADIPQFSGRHDPIVISTSRMLAVSTIASVDGKVCISLDHGPELRGILAYEGKLETPTGAVAATQSSAEEIIRLLGVDNIVVVEVGVDDLRFPARVHVLIRK